jgi:FAD:protein FMN transferase
MKTIQTLSEQTKRDAYVYFDIKRDGSYDPSGIVKGWAIQNAANMLKAQGFHNFYVNAGGNIQVAGKTDDHLWRVGIRNPFSRSENVKGLARTKQGIAPSGTAIRGQHIYNPYHRNKPMLDSARITVIGLNVYEADQFATAVCAMEKKGGNLSKM